jgi:plasmid stabilization system protein ParE
MAGRLAHFSPKARQWFLAEFAYVAKRNPAAAETILARLVAARRTLADHPRIGTPGSVAGTRRFAVAPYVLTVVIRGGVVETVAIRHGRQAELVVDAGETEPA